MWQGDRALLLFGLSALIAALAIGLGITERPAEQAAGVPVAAWVNGQSVAEVRYASALLAMQNRLGRALTTADRQQALTHIINEELLLQEALAIGLARSDVLVRKNLIQAMVQSQTLQTETPDEATLRDFFARKRARFTPEVKVSLQVRAATTDKAAAAFAKAVTDGAPFISTAETMGLKTIALAERLPLHQIALHLGGSARDQVARMEANDIAGPLSINQQHVFLWLVQKDVPSVRFEDMRTEVQAAWQRQQEVATIERYFTQLRDKADIRYQVLPEVPYLQSPNP